MSSGLPGSRDEAKRAGMMTWNTSFKLCVQQWIIGAKNPCLFRQHHGDSLAHRIRQPVRTANQFKGAARAGAAQGTLADGTYQQFEQSFVHGVLYASAARL